MRYFFIAYRSIAVDGRHITGNINIKSNSTYPSLELIIDRAIYIASESDIILEDSSIVITNIIELSKKDFNSLHRRND